MYPQTHILLSLIFAVLLKLATPFDYISLGIIVLASILIDIDHWFIYVLKTKKLSVIGAYNWFIALEKLKEKPRLLCVFHTIEFFAIIFILSLNYQIFQLILIGMIFHMFLDIADSIVKKEYRKEIFLIYWIIRH